MPESPANEVITVSLTSKEAHAILAMVSNYTCQDIVKAVGHDEPTLESAHDKLNKALSGPIKLWWR